MLPRAFCGADSWSVRRRTAGEAGRQAPVTRVLSAAALLAVVVVTIWLLPPAATVVVVAAALVIAVVEYAGLAKAGGVDVARVPATLAALAAAAAVAFEPAALAPVLLASLVLIGVAELAGASGDGALSRAAVGAFAAVYLALPFGVLADLRLNGGPEALSLLVVTVIASDTAQYYGGRTLGRRLLAPAISPKKTVEGAAFGIAAGMLVLGLDPGGWLPELAPAGRVLLGAGVAVAGIAGDLFESRLKRASGVKDSSALIPGHGGLLDRVDGLLFAAPAYWLAVRLAT